MQKIPLLRTFTAGVIAICLSFHLTGCAVTPLNHVGAFSQASAELAKNTADAYAYVNETTIQRKINDVAAMGNTPEDKVFEGLIDKSGLAIRISLLRGVEDYSKSLGNLASADFRKEIDAASKDLYGSLGELQNTYKVATKEKFPLSGDNLAIIATAIDAIGTAIAENKHGLVVLAHAVPPTNLTNAKRVLWAQQTAGANTWTATVNEPITWRDETVGNFRFDVEVVSV